MSARQRNQASPKEEGDGNTVVHSSDTSRWSTPIRLDRGSYGPQSPERGDKVDSLIGRTLDDQPSMKWKGSKKSGSNKVKKVQEHCKPTANHQSLKLPPITALQVSGPAPSTIYNKELRNQVWDLQRQLSEARAENKLLKKVQHRYEVALQHFQEGSISQILEKHRNETRTLQSLLRETRISRDNTARLLKATESKLLETKAALNHQKLLSQDQSLLEREELTLRLAEATAKLNEKDRKIQDMEKMLVLSQASFKRDIIREQRKIKEARKTSFYLQQQIYQLTRDLQDREKALEKHNIYSHRYTKESKKQVKGDSMVQTDGLNQTYTLRLVETGCSERDKRPEQPQSSEGCHKPVQGNLAPETPNATLEENHQENAQTLAGHSVFIDISSDDSCSEELSEESLQNQSEDEWTKESDTLEEASEAEYEDGASHLLEMSPNANEPKSKEHKLPTLKHKYIFKQTFDNLHVGRPAYYNAIDGSTKSTMKVEIPSSGIRDVCSTGGKSKRVGDSSLSE